MRIVSLASGSGGNAYCVQSGSHTLLVDCGVSYRIFKARCKEADVDPGSVSAVVFTHDHIDHARGVPMFAKCRPETPLFANWMTAEAISHCLETDAAFNIFENGQTFQAGPFEITAFSVPHDVPDPVGFMVKAENFVYFHATDVGAPLDSIGAHLMDADAATLESNHDPVLLETSARPECLKRRIRGDRGHLSNFDASGLVRRFARPKLKALALAHLSEECNAPHLARESAAEALRDAGLHDVRLSVLRQDGPVEIWKS